MVFNKFRLSTQEIQNNGNLIYFVQVSDSFSVREINDKCLKKVLSQISRVLYFAK
jgi:hypothetical protein